MIRSYVITHDHGFSPNYDPPALTLACCKPRIRKTAVVGDWIVGTHSKKRGWNRLCFAAQVSAAMSFDEYHRDPVFISKRPTPDNFGDAIYRRGSGGRLVQVRNRGHNSAHFGHDTSVDRVLVCERFWHFGAGLPLPEDLADFLVKRGPGHRNISSPNTIAVFEEFIAKYPEGRVSPL